MRVAVDVEGIFRLSGSEKRIKELREAFNSPDRYGKGLDWTGYTVHDAANILRRYFNQLPEPIIPLEFYEAFREPLRNHQAQAVGPMDGQKESIGDFDMDIAIRVYQRLITELPPLNRQLLLYILDLLAVFASKSDLNKMTTANLAAIFQPGILSHPTHDMAPPEYRLSQDVLIFLIENQDNFLIGMQGTEADPKTVEEVESGPSTPSGKAPATPTRSKTTIGRSSSNASAGAESVRKQGMVRRNVSVSSRKSKNSNTVATPSPVNTTFASGVHRSNTVPSKKSPAIVAKRFPRDNGEPQSPGAVPRSPAVISIAEPVRPTVEVPTTRRPAHVLSPPSSEDTTPLAAPPSVTSATGLLPHRETPQKSRAESSERETPGGFRSFSSMFQSSPHSDTEGKEKRRPNKLQKKRAPSTNPSAASSTNSLHGSHAGGPPSPLPPGVAAGTPIKDHGHNISPIAETSPPKATTSANPLQPSMSPSASMRSHSTVSGGYSEAEHGDDATAAENAEKEKKRHWRGTHRKEGSKPANEAYFGSISGAEQSMSSVSSKGGRKSPTTTDPSEASNSTLVWNEPKEGDKKANPIGWFRSKLTERKEREDAKHRAKSPPNNRVDPSSPTSGSERHRSTSSLTAFTHHRRGRSADFPRATSHETPTAMTLFEAPRLEAAAKQPQAGLTAPKQPESEEVTPTQTPGSMSTSPVPPFASSASAAASASAPASASAMAPMQTTPASTAASENAPAAAATVPTSVLPPQQQGKLSSFLPPSPPPSSEPAATTAPKEGEAPAAGAPAATPPSAQTTPREQPPVRSMLDV